MTRIAVFSQARCAIFITQAGNWVVEKRQKRVELKCFQDLLFFVSLLEEPLERVQQEVRSGLLANQLSLDLETSFPYGLIVAFGLMSQSTKWISLAMKWLDKIPIDGTVQTALAILLAKKTGTQRDRFRAKQLIRQSLPEDQLKTFTIEYLQRLSNHKQVIEALHESEVSLLHSIPAVPFDVLPLPI